MSGMDDSRMRTRDIGRNAVREELARVAFPLFCEKGFEKVTFDDLARIAGVSRSTFLRYFGSKEEVVLFSFDPLGEQMTEALRARPAEEEDWTALRRALEPAVAFLRRDPAEGLVLLRLVGGTPSLCARLREKQAGWRPGLAEALADRSAAPEVPRLALSVRAGAAMECFTLALEHWVAADGRPDLDTVIDEAFSAFLSPAPAAG